MRLFVTTMGSYTVQDPGGQDVAKPIPVGLAPGTPWMIWDTDEPDPYVLCLADIDTDPTAGWVLGDPMSAAYHTDPAPRPYVNAVKSYLGLGGGDKTFDGATMAELVKAVLPQVEIDVDAGWPDEVTGYEEVVHPRSGVIQVPIVRVRKTKVVTESTVERRGRPRKPHPKDRFGGAVDTEPRPSPPTGPSGEQGTGRPEGA